MDISFIHAGLAAGAALAALPVILHLFMRQTPKKVVFPALRLIKERQKRSRKKLRVKNWLLLLARMALVAFMALALARPRVVSETTAGGQDTPAAIGLVFDTSLSMGYTERDKTRLDEAKQLARDILSRTPGSSVAFVIDSAEPTAPPSLSPAAAQKRIDGLTLRPDNKPLNAAVGQAYNAVSAVDKPAHAVYIFTDLARSAWDTEQPAEGLEKAQKLKSGMQTYVIRLTPKNVRDVAVVEAQPVSETATEGEPLDVVARVRSLGPATTRVAELWVDGVARGKKPVELPENGEAEVRFTIPKVDGNSPLHQGEVRLSGVPDGLTFDDVRYFTFSVRPAVRVLIVSDQTIDSQFIADAIDPDPASLPPGTPRPFRVERIKTSAFSQNADNLIKRYRCIFLNNVAELSESEWGKLSGYVADGGGLVVGLGNAVRPASYATGAASQILPATLEKITTAKEATRFGQVTDYTHPIFQKYSKDLDQMLSETPITRHWLVKPGEGSRVLLSFADKSPALVERVFKGARPGRVLLWTTPLSRRPDSTSKDAWNEWPVVGWSFFYVMNQSAAYLAGTTEQALNFEAGRDVVLPLDPSRRAKSYNVQGPDRKATFRLAPPSDSDALVVASPQQLGQWTVTPSADDSSGEKLGFSVNVAEGESQFVPLEKANLDTLFGKDKYALAESPEELVETERLVKVGRELFPPLMFAIMLLVILESYLANRFYRETPKAAAVAAGTV